jgi:hypothetical protein
MKIKISLSAKPELDMGKEARMLRAKKLGFDTNTVYYHGSDDTISAFDDAALKHEKFGHFFSDDKDFAEVNYGHNTHPSFLSIRNPKLITHSQWDAIRDDFQRDPNRFKDLRTMLKSNGYDCLKIVESTTMFAGHLMRNPNIIVMFDTTKIRSIAAMFDPKHANSSNVMA